jgi:ankyrin repeat protein
VSEILFQGEPHNAPLALAVENRKLEIVKLLLSRGADVNVKGAYLFQLRFRGMQNTLSSFTWPHRIVCCN